MYAHNANRSSPNIPGAYPTARVCGSLDPPGRSQKTSKSGWRYIQLTDTPDELRVLLPPRPAAIYANLLKVEAHALARNDAESLRDLQSIRYLKDVMIKRCQRLAQDTIRELSATKGSRPVSVVRAPVDFKVKRLEQWWEMMEPQVKTKSHSNHTNTRAYAEQPAGMQNNASTTTLSPPTNSQVHGTTVAQAHISHGIAVAHQPYVVDAQASPHLGKKRPTPLTVPPAGQTYSAQSSPLVPHTPQSPNIAVLRTMQHPGFTQSPLTPYDYHRPEPPQTTSRRTLYTNSQTASPLETPYNPSFDPNQSLAAQQYLQHYASTRSPVVAVKSEMPMPRRDPRAAGQHVYTSADALAEPAAGQIDPSLLKNRFQAMYFSSPSDSASSPSSNDSKASGYAQRSHRSNESRSSYSTGAGHTPYIRPNASLPTPSPSNAGSMTYERDHRRRATVDCEDTDRSIPRPKAYMYRTDPSHDRSYDASSDALYGDQDGRVADSDHSTSAVRRMVRALNQSIAPGGSPAGSHGSPRLHGSPYAMEDARSSPGKRQDQTQSYCTTLSAGDPHAHSSGSTKKGSPNLLPPDSGLSRMCRGSDDIDPNGSNASIVQSGNGYSGRQLRRTTSRRSLRDPSPSADSQPVLPPPEYYASQPPRSPRTAAMVPADMQQPSDPDTYRRGRTRRGEKSCRHYTYEHSPRHEVAVMPAVSSVSSRRNSRYTSGESSVSEPVIPDVSLIMEAELSRNKGDRVRRRLVPFQSSSEEGDGRHASDWEGSEVSSSDDEVPQATYYRPPYGARDGYESDYASEAGHANSRAPSRAPSRSPSRGILKRSSSVCSARSNKSVRLEIPRDRRALEEVRDAEDKVDRAQRQLEDLQRRKGSRFKNGNSDIQKATEALDEAKQGLKEKEDEYQAILAAMKLKRTEQDQTRPRYV